MDWAHVAHVTGASSCSMKLTNNTIVQFTNTTHTKKQAGSILIIYLTNKLITIFFKKVDVALDNTIFDSTCKAEIYQALEYIGNIGLDIEEKGDI